MEISREQHVADYRDHTGKRHWETYETRKEAEQALAKSTAALKDGKYATPNDKRTVADAHKSWRTLCVEGSDNRSGKPLRPTSAAFYSTVWRVHLEPRWGALKLRQVDSESLARWKQEQLDAGMGARTMLCALQVMGSLFKHARRFGWTSANPLEHVHRPRHTYSVQAFTPAQIASLLDVAEPDMALIIRLLASTGMRFGELAGLRWSCVDLDRGVIHGREQYTHDAWSELKTDNAKRSIPLPVAIREERKSRYAALVGNVVQMRPAQDRRMVFTAPDGAGPLNYSNWRVRRWLPLLKATAPDATHPKRIAVAGSPHMLRHSYATASVALRGEW